MRILAFPPCAAPLGGQQTVSLGETTRLVPPRTSAPARPRSLPAKFLIVLTVGLLGAAVTERASADLIAYDQFVGYDAGQLVGQGKGFGWADAWEGNTNFTVSDSGGLTHGALPGLTDGGGASTGSTNGGVWRDLETPLPGVGTYYFGFLMKASGNAHNAVLGLDENGDGSGNIAYGGSWNSESYWCLAEKDGTGYSHSNTFIPETSNTTLFVMVLYLKASGQDIAVLYVDPANAARLAQMHNAERYYANDFGQVSTVRAGLNINGPNDSFVFDEIRIGTNPEDMFSVIPEPGTLSLLALGGLAVLRRRRR